MLIPIISRLTPTLFVILLFFSRCKCTYIFGINANIFMKNITNDAHLLT